MNTENNKKTDCLPRVGINDGFILWTVYHLFDVLRQVSLFQQIRNISRLLWKKKYQHSHPNASKEDMDNAWVTNRPFTTRYLFSEIYYYQFDNDLYTILVAGVYYPWICYAQII